VLYQKKKYPIMPERSVERVMFFGAKPKIFNKARELRSKMTAAEKILWDRLSNKKVNGYRFKPQHPISNFIVDFYCHKAKLVIEVDGEIHNQQQEYDIGRTDELKNFGLDVIRFSNKDVETRIEWVVSEIQKAVEKRLENLSPAPKAES
jgi:very-short-patch-repair endonuclease